MAMSNRLRISLGIRAVTALALAGISTIGITIIALLVTIIVGTLLFYFASVLFAILLYIVDQIVPWPVRSITDPIYGSVWPYLLFIVLLLVLYALLRRPYRIGQREFRTSLLGHPAEKTHPRLQRVANRLAEKGGISPPTVQVRDEHRPESYVISGPEGPIIVVTTGLLSMLDPPEVEAVLAHELSHVINRDRKVIGYALIPLVIGTILNTHFTTAGENFIPRWPYTFGRPGAVLLLKAWIIVSIFTWLQVYICNLGVKLFSRGREYAADAGAAALTGSPESLANALGKIESSRNRPAEDKRAVHPAEMTIDILPWQDSAKTFWFERTHPPTEKRIRRLEAMVQQYQY